MNLSQVVNIFLRVVMRMIISRGVNAGMRQMGGRKRRRASIPPPQRQPMQDDLSKSEIRASRRARRAVREARHTSEE